MNVQIVLRIQHQLALETPFLSDMSKNYDVAWPCYLPVAIPPVPIAAVKWGPERLLRPPVIMASLFILLLGSQQGMSEITSTWPQTLMAGIMRIYCKSSFFNAMITLNSHRKHGCNLWATYKVIEIPMESDYESPWRKKGFSLIGSITCVILPQIGWNTTRLKSSATIHCKEQQILDKNYKCLSDWSHNYCDANSYLKLECSRCSCIFGDRLLIVSDKNTFSVLYVSLLLGIRTLHNSFFLSCKVLHSSYCNSSIVSICILYPRERK